MASWFATEDPDPRAESGERQSGGTDGDFGGDIAGFGLNTVRGGAADTIGRLICARPERTEAFEPAIRHLSRDPSLAVRSMAAQVLVAVLGTNSDFAVDQFSTLCDAPDQLLGTRAVEDFVYYSVNTHPSQIVPIIQRMRSADDVKARMAGTRQACLAALSTDEYRTLLKDCIEGPEESRSEAAGILARNLTAASRKTECSAALIALFNDPDLSVRMKASECFQFFKKDELRGAEELIMSFVDSTAFSTGCGGLLYAVDRTTAPLPRITLHVCERSLVSGKVLCGIR
jgi:hypothetical protein